MKWITTRLRVIGECDRYWHQGKQYLVRNYYLLGWLRIWQKVLDHEDVPQHVYISNGCFGDTGGWVSKFAPFGPKGWKS